jgi:hypothetical protein
MGVQVGVAGLLWLADPWIDLGMQAISSSRQVPISHIVEGPNIWRGKSFDTSDLEESLERAPLLAPLVVRAVPGKRSQWEVIAGHRRLRAAKKKGWSHIEARVVAVNDEQAELLSLEENLRRKDVRTPLQALSRLHDLYELTNPTRRGGDHKSKVFRESNGHRDHLNAIGKLAQMTGKSPREVRRLLKVGKASPQVQKRYSNGELTLVQVEALAGGRRLKLLKMPRTNDHLRALEALRYALRAFRTAKPQGRTRREALSVTQELHRVLR